MEIFGIGPLELVFILLLAIVVLGPKDMLAGARSLARFIRRLTHSEIWQQVKDVQQLPRQIMRETGLEDELRQMNMPTISPVTSAWTAPTPQETHSQVIQPPQASIDGDPTQTETPPTNG